MDNAFVPTPSPFTYETFVRHVGTNFVVTRPDGVTVNLELISAEPLQLKPMDGRALGKAGYVRTDPFVLLFRGDEMALARQGLYQFDHPEVGQFQMGVVPVGPGETGWQYESVFN